MRATSVMRGYICEFGLAPELEVPELELELPEPIIAIY
jgi:hypothetical protein